MLSFLFLFYIKNLTILFNVCLSTWLIRFIKYQFLRILTSLFFLPTFISTKLILNLLLILFSNTSWNEYKFNRYSIPRKLESILRRSNSLELDICHRLTPSRTFSFLTYISVVCGSICTFCQLICSSENARYR